MSPTSKVFTLVFLKKPNEVLLGYKTRGLGKGLWNGFGGKLESNESIENCAKRELKEECNLIVEQLKHIGIVKYEVDNRMICSIVHVFTSDQFHGNEMGSEEMNPIKWYKTNEIPFEQMWPDANKWYPFMLNNKFFFAHVIYNDRGKIRKTTITEHDEFENVLKLI